MQFFQPPITSFLLGPNILLTLFSGNLTQCFSFNISAEVSHPYRITDKSVVSYIHVHIFWQQRIILQHPAALCASTSGFLLKLHFSVSVQFCLLFASLRCKYATLNPKYIFAIKRRRVNRNQSYRETKKCNKKPEWIRRQKVLDWTVASITRA
jgi:hypothetical protein